MKCKKAALKDGATSAAQPRATASTNAGTPGSIAADTKGKIEKAVDKLNADIVKKCDTPGVTRRLPRRLQQPERRRARRLPRRQVECRVCQMINEMDGLFVNCDLFDDGVANASCASGAGPTPTPTDDADPDADADRDPTAPGTGDLPGRARRRPPVASTTT